MHSKQRGVSRVKLPSEGYRATGRGIAAIVPRYRAERATKCIYRGEGGHCREQKKRHPKLPHAGALPNKNALNMVNLVLSSEEASLRAGPTTTTTIFEFISRGPIFQFLGYPRMTRQMPLLHSGTQRNHKDFSSDVPSNAVLVWHRMENVFGRLWLWLCVGRP